MNKTVQGLKVKNESIKKQIQMNIWERKIEELDKNLIGKPRQQNTGTRSQNLRC